MAKNDQGQTRPEEWRQAKRWNPFNSFKLLAHVGRWQHIARSGVMPAPALVTVDPTNRCNLGCVWCNAANVRSERGRSLSGKFLANLAEFLPSWGKSANPHFGVDAVCIGGGGEPLMNPHTPEFIEQAVANGLEVGMVTNGSRLDGIFPALAKCTWIGVSLDAANPGTFDRLKGTAPEAGMFEKTVNGVTRLNEYIRSHSCRLGEDKPAYGITLKYLVYRENAGEMLEATRLAKRIGCKGIHFRPAATTWDNVGGGSEIAFSPAEIELFREQLEEAFLLDDADFSVYGVTHKTADDFTRRNQFEQCHAVFMTTVFSPAAAADAPDDAFVMSLCCDRRGDAGLELLRDVTDVQEIARAWGGEKHWRIHDAIDIQRDCPRCTYQPHNQIFENVIVKDSMTYKFI